jgi:hypothetical protein
MDDFPGVALFCFCFAAELDAVTPQTKDANASAVKLFAQSEGAMTSIALPPRADLGDRVGASDSVSASIMPFVAFCFCSCSRVRKSD